MNSGVNRQDPPDTHYLPSYTPRTRDAPPSGPPPGYAAAIGRVYPYTLRPVILFTSFITFLYLLLIGIAQFKDAAGDGVSSKLKLMNIIQGVLLIVVALIEVLGFAAAFKSNLKMAAMYARLVLPAYAIVAASQILGVVSHYTLKKDEIDACVVQNTGRRVSDGGVFWWGSGSSNSYPLTEDDAKKYCQDQWNSESTWAIVWLIVVLIVGIPFVLFSFAFVRQLRDPSMVRVRVQPMWSWGRSQQPPSAQYAQSGPYDPQAQAYAMGAYPHGHYPPPPSGPYARPTGPPPDGNDLPDYHRGSHVDKDDFNDSKSPAGDGYDYAPHFGARPGSSRGANSDARENDDAKDSQVTVTLDDDENKRSGARAGNRDGDDGPRI